MAVPNVQLQPLPLFEIASFHQAAGRKPHPDTTLGFVIGVRGVQDVVAFATSPFLLNEEFEFDSDVTNPENYTIQRLRLTLKVKSMFQGRRCEPQVVGWYFCGPPATTATLDHLQRTLWPLAQAAVVFPEPDDDNDYITHFRDLRVSCADPEAAVCFCIDATNHFSPSAAIVSSSTSRAALSLQPKHVHQETSIIKEPPLKISDPLPEHVLLLSESIRVLAEKVAHISQQIEQQVNGTAPCSRTLRRRAASIMQQLQRLQIMNFSERLQDVTANVDAARTLQALFSSTAQLQKLMAVTSLRTGQ